MDDFECATSDPVTIASLKADTLFQGHSSAEISYQLGGLYAPLLKC